MTPRHVLKRLAALFDRRRLEDELDDEIRAHLELAERDARAAGLSPDEARAAARRSFGGIEQMKEQHRDVRGVRWLDTLARDTRYGVAALRRDPMFTVVAIGVLALGVGANAAMFSLLDAVLLKPLPFDAPDRIVRVWEAPRPGVTNSTSTLDFLDWREMGTSFSAVAAEDELSMAFQGDGEPIRLPAAQVTADYFKVFAVQPALGRTFAPGDDRPDAAPVVVLSHAVWRTHFGADPGILQRRPILDGQPRQVIGVLPAGVFDQSGAAIWIPLVFTPDRMTRDWHWLSIAARLRPGVTAAQAREELRAIRAAQGDAIPASKRAWSIEVAPLEGLLVGDALRRSLFVAAGAVVLVLCIACANVASLLLARGAARGRELAIRVALGASRGRLLAQLLAETVVLGLLGGVAGLLLAWWTVRAARPVLRDFLPSSAVVSVDARVLAFTFATAFGAALLAGVFPAWHAARHGISASMNAGGRGTTASRGRLRRALVAAEVALSIVLLCGALLLFATVRNLLHLDPGVRLDGVTTMSIDLPPRSYATPERAGRFAADLIARLEGAPGIARAGLATVLPMRWIGNGEAITLPGVGEPIRVRFKRVDAGYFDTLDMPLVAGRGFTAADRPGSPPVVVLNQALAAQVATAARVTSPIGRSARIGYVNFDRRFALDAQIVGVIRSERTGDPWRPDPPVLYVPLAQAPHSQLKLLVRSDAATQTVVPIIRAAVRAVDPALPLGNVATLSELRDRTYVFASRPAWAVGAFAAVAVLLAALGLYGVLAQSVTQRRREIGIRLALGASPGRLVRQTLAGSVGIIALGSLAGLGATVALVPVIRSVLFGVSGAAPFLVAAGVAGMWIVGVAATLVPARRAARVDPLLVLRDEL